MSEDEIQTGSQHSCFDPMVLGVFMLHSVFRGSGSGKDISRNKENGKCMYSPSFLGTVLSKSGEDSLSQDVTLFPRLAF